MKFDVNEKSVELEVNGKPPRSTTCAKALVASTATSMATRSERILPSRTGSRGRLMKESGENREVLTLTSDVIEKGSFQNENSSLFEFKMITFENRVPIERKKTKRMNRKIKIDDCRFV